MKKRRIGAIYCQGNPTHEIIMIALHREVRLLGPDYILVVMPTKKGDEDSVVKELNSAGGVASCEMLVPIGMFITEIVCRLYGNGFGIPICFVAVPRPNEQPFLQPFIHSLERPGGLVSGVTAEGNLSRYAYDIAKFYPLVSRIILPYCPSRLGGIVGETALAIAEHLRKIGMIVHAEPISTPQEAAAKIDAHMSDIDGIIFMEGCLTNDIAAETAVIAWQNEKVFFVSQVAGIELGAAVSFGADCAVYAAPLAEKIRLYFEEHVPMGRQPIIILPDTRHCMVNRTMLCQVRHVDHLFDEFLKDNTIEVIREWPTGFKPDLGVDDSMCYDPTTGGWSEKEESSDG